MAPNPAWDPDISFVEGPASWGHERLGQWLRSRGLPSEITALFEEHLVNGVMAATLSCDDLSAMGVVHPLRQRRLLCELRQLFVDSHGRFPVQSTACQPEHGGVHCRIAPAVGAAASHRCRSPRRPQSAKAARTAGTCSWNYAAIPSCFSSLTSVASRPQRGPTLRRQRSCSPMSTHRRALIRAGMEDSSIQYLPQDTKYSSQNALAQDMSTSSAYLNAAQALTQNGTLPRALSPHAPSGSPPRQRRPRLVCAASAGPANPSSNCQQLHPHVGQARALERDAPRIPCGQPFQAVTSPEIPELRTPCSQPSSESACVALANVKKQLTRAERFPSGQIAKVEAPTFVAEECPAAPGAASPESFGALSPDIVSDALELAGELAVARLSSESSLKNLENTSAHLETLQVCSTRLAEVTRDRAVLRTELSKTRQKFEAKSVEKDRHLAKMNSERTELLQRLRLTNKRCGQQARECERLRHRLRLALAWASDDCPGGAGDELGWVGGGKAPSREPSQSRLSTKQVVFEVPSALAGCPPQRLRASDGVRGCSNEEDGHLVHEEPNGVGMDLDFAGNSSSFPDTAAPGPRGLLQPALSASILQEPRGEVAPLPGRARVGAIGIKARPATVHATGQ